MKKTLWIYTLIGVGLSASLAASFQTRLNVHPYVTWISATTVVTWALYAWDKRISQLGSLLKGWRVPEFTLNLMALSGGFLGAWVARSMFNHKTNLRRHRDMFVILIVSAVLHVLFVVRLLYGPPLTLWPPSNWVSF
ncbi:MAG: DUF1294 domain-containing protein [Anaerolineae bacterium]